jgi:hypothetical protein
MPKSKYSQYIVTELRTPNFPPEFVTAYKQFATRILWMDANVVPGAFQMNCSWYLKPNTHGAEAHQHDVDEIIGFFGNDAANPYDLHGQIEFWIEDRQFIIHKTTMIFLPAGLKHCPLIIRRVDNPIFHFSTVTGGKYVQQKSEGRSAPSKVNYDKYVVTELKMPEEKKRINNEYIKYATRTLWMDKDVVPGAFHMNTAWFFRAGPTLEDKPHTHENDEIIGFFGNDAARPNDLGAEVEFWIEGEKQSITRSAMLFIPAGMVHCPMVLKRVDRPIFHFTVVPSGLYIKDETGK